MVRRRRSQHPAFGERIKKARIENGWTQDDLADRLGVSHGYPGELERGSFEPSRTMVHRLAVVLALDEDELLGLLGWGRQRSDGLTYSVDTAAKARRMRQLARAPLYVLDELVSFVQRLGLASLDDPETVPNGEPGREE